MAAELLLLVLLFSNILAEVVKKAGTSYDFQLDETADICSVYRWSGEEKELLWDSSLPHDSTMPKKISYKISSLNVSDSGRYQEQCWTGGTLTHDRNTTLLVCDKQKMHSLNLYPHSGQTVQLTCDGLGPIQWAISYKKFKSKNTELALVDEDISSLYQLQQGKDRSLRAHIRAPLGVVTYYCLEKSHQSCNLLRQYFVYLPQTYILRSVGESLEMNCSGLSGDKTRVWTRHPPMVDDEVMPGNTLMLPLLTLNHTDTYTCSDGEAYREYYILIVCPEPETPAEVFVTEGQNVTLHCGNQKRGGRIPWFMRPDGANSRLSLVHEYQGGDHMHISNGSLTITNISREDAGEFSCVVFGEHRCAFAYKTLVRFRDAKAT